MISPTKDLKNRISKIDMNMESSLDATAMPMNESRLATIHNAPLNGSFT